MPENFTLTNVTLATGQRLNISVSNGRVTNLGNQQEGLQVDCSGLIAFSGFVDLHTHLRQPGFEDSETVLSGSMAGSTGGFTAIHAMANTSPVADTPAIVDRVHQLGLEAGLLDVRPVASITKGLQGIELSPMKALMNSTAKVRVFSDDGVCVSNRKLMRDALRFSARNGVVISQHSQDPDLTEGSQMNESQLADDLGLVGWPREAEESVIASDIALAFATGGHLHVCHITTKAGVDLVRWGKSKGANITAEVTPHHLLLTEDLVAGYDANFKVNPPLRTSSDTIALRQGLIDGTIDVVATDHAPHSIEKKACEWQSAAFGMLGLETAASVLQQVLQAEANWPGIMQRVLSEAPSKIGQLADQGCIAIGNFANLTLIDPDARRVISAKGYSKSANNPYKGMDLPGRVVHTVYRGRFTIKDEVVQYG